MDCIGTDDGDRGLSRTPMQGLILQSNEVRFDPISVF
jgi:hypothetical protein